MEEAICVYDFCERLGIEVRFVDIPSLEGMLYCNHEPTIIVSSHRPAVRQAFTCAHELGHLYSGDGTTIDDLVGKSHKFTSDPKEFMADCFAGALLMPKMAVQRAFAVRSWSIGGSTPGQIYTVSGYFGVGYATLVHHLWNSLKLIQGSHAEGLLKVGRRNAQAQALGWDSAGTVRIVDPYWNCRAIDLEVGEFVQVQVDTACEGNCFNEVCVSGSGRLYRASQPGIGRLSSASGWAGYVRVSRKKFVGRSIFRHLAEEGGE